MDLSALFIIFGENTFGMGVCVVVVWVPWKCLFAESKLRVCKLKLKQLCCSSSFDPEIWRAYISRRGTEHEAAPGDGGGKQLGHKYRKAFQRTKWKLWVQSRRTCSSLQELRKHYFWIWRQWQKFKAGFCLNVEKSFFFFLPFVNWKRTSSSVSLSFSDLSDAQRCLQVGGDRKPSCAEDLGQDGAGGSITIV